VPTQLGAFRNWATLFPNLQSILPQQSSFWVVCHIIWTITNHASVKQTKRAQGLLTPPTPSTIYHPVYPTICKGFWKFASKSYFRIRGAHSNGRRQTGLKRKRTNHIWVLRAFRCFCSLFCGSYARAHINLVPTLPRYESFIFVFPFKISCNWTGTLEKKRAPKGMLLPPDRWRVVDGVGKGCCLLYGKVSHRQYVGGTWRSTPEIAYKLGWTLKEIQNYNKKIDSPAQMLF